MLADELVRRLPDAHEGELSQLKNHVRSRESCAAVAERLGLGARLAARGRGLGGATAGLVDNPRVLADVCEAAVGAVFLAHGWPTTRDAVIAAFDERIEWARRGHLDAKTALQEVLQRQGRSVEYVLVARTGPAHAPHFVTAAVVEGAEIGRGEGSSKKASERVAAQAALAALERDGR